ncbi:MAG: hypothetical protein IKO79_09015, partial [Butyrivibrio sp.]|nr:hypothetical protein [Butyrivibrio sp.]
MRNLKAKAFSAMLSLAVFTGVSFSGTATLEAYAADDPYTAFSKATTVYNGVDYKAEYNPLYYYLNYADL